MDTVTVPMSQISITIYVHYILFAFAIYEHLITFYRELHCVWFHKFTKCSAIFYLNRYSLLALVIVLLMKDHMPSAYSCAVFARINQALDLILCFCTSIFTAWRVSVVWGNNLAIFILLLTLVTSPFVMYLVLSIKSHRTYIYVQETHRMLCQAVPDLSASTRGKMNTATRTSVLVGDTLAVLLTWIKTYKNVKTFHETKALDLGSASTTLGTGMNGTRRKSVMESIMRGGTLYFVTLLGLSLSMLLIKNTTLVTSILHTCTGVLVSRFIMDLREVPLGNAENVAEAAVEMGGRGSGWEYRHGGDGGSAGRIYSENIRMSQLSLDVER